jgi:hypothetical protein
MTEEYEREAAAAERELADMEERSERVGEHIDEARKDWDAKVADPGVPGAAGEPDRAEEGGRHPETAYPAKGSSDELSEDEGSEDEGSEHELPPPDPYETD